MKRILFACTVLLSLGLSAQDPMTEIPFTLYGDHIFIKVSIDDSRELDFIFDTGSGLTVIDIDVATELGLSMANKKTVTSAQGEVTTAMIKHNTLEVHDFPVEGDITVSAISLNHLEQSIGKNVDGIIGYDMVKHHAVRVDYNQNRFEVFPVTSFPKHGETISFKLHNYIPTVDLSVKLNNGETMKGSFLIQTGAGSSLDFNSPFANSNDIISKTGEHYSYLVKGLGDNEVLHYEGYVSSLTLGSFEIQNMPIGISQATSGLQADKKVAGIIGNKLLKKFNITYDYKGGKLYVMKNGHYDKKLIVNCSGIDVQLDKAKTKVLIHRVFENSPASEAGLQVDSELISIDGKSAMDIGIYGINEILERDGETVELKVKEGDTERTISLALKSLI